VIYEFDACVLDTGTQQLWRDGEVVHVEPQVLAVLEYLAANSDRMVTKIELLDEVWGDRFVSESALTSRIKSARKATGDDGRTQGVIRTVHGTGYTFVAEVVEVAEVEE
jgi:DNA-binding winged helix-turn-helix (wHTH) protein